jgi:hypothetical protein
MLTLVLVALAGAAAGYGFRGFVNKYIKTAGVEVKTEVSKVATAVKTDVDKKL